MPSYLFFTLLKFVWSRFFFTAQAEEGIGTNDIGMHSGLHSKVQIQANIWQTLNCLF